MSTFKSRRQIIADLKKKRQTQESLHENIVKIRASLLHKKNFVSRIFLKGSSLSVKHIHELISLGIGVIDKIKKLGGGFISIWNCQKSSITHVGACVFSRLSKVLKGVILNFYSGTRQSFRFLKIPQALFWKYRFYILTFSLFSLIVCNARFLWSRYPQQPLVFQMQLVNYWPTLPYSHLSLAKKSFDLGYQDMANIFLTNASRQMSYLEPLHLDILFAKQFQDTKLWIQQPELKTKQLEALNQRLEKSPYSWELLLDKAKLEAELYNQKELEKTLALITWLYPNFPSSTRNQLQN